MWYLNDAHLELRGPKCVKNISIMILHSNRQPEPLIRGRKDPCHHVVYAKISACHLNAAAEINTHQTSQCFFSNHLFNFGSPWKLYSQFPVCSWKQEWHPAWSAVCILQGLTWCAFGEGVLHTSVVTKGYFIHFFLLQYGLSSLASTRHFQSERYRSLDIVCFSYHSL